MGHSRKVSSRPFTGGPLAITAQNPASNPDDPSDTVLQFPDNRLLIDLCGELDRNIVQIEARLGVEVRRRGNHLALHGGARARRGRAGAAQRSTHRLEQGRPVTPGDIDAAIRMPGRRAARRAEARAGPARHVLGRADRDPHPPQAGRAAHRGAEGLRAQPLPQRAGLRPRAGGHRQDLSRRRGGGVDVHRGPRGPDHAVAGRRSRRASGSASCPAT